MSEPIIKGGYILLSRNIIEEEIWKKPPLYIKVWIYLLLKAQHKDYKELKRGQVFTSIPDIIEACSWYVGYRKESPSRDQIFQIIEWLRKCHEKVHEGATGTTMITTTKATHGLLVNIDKYCFYQTPDNYEGNNESNTEKATRATRGQRQPDNINKNDKNGKNENKYTPEFDRFYSLYPNPDCKTRSFTNWKNCLKSHTAEELINAAINYKAKVEPEHREKRFIKSSANFLGKEKYYLDYLDKPQEEPKDRKLQLVIIEKR